jgi:anti-sigma factor RsiW
MVTGTHPEDFDLFDYLEGDLPASRRAEVEAHLASCAQCAEQVALVQAGRGALLQSQPLELSPRRRDGILRNLPPQPKETRGWGISLKHVVAALTPVAAVALVVVALVTVDGSNDEEGAAGGGADTAELSAPAGDSEGAGEALQKERKDESRRTLLFDGPPGAVALQLRRKGLAATAVGDHVEVRNASRAEVRRALASRRDGSVRIVIVP